jgi:hypothetical protein
VLLFFNPARAGGRSCNVKGRHLELKHFYTAAPMLPEIYINKVLFEQGQLRRKTFVVILPRQQPIWQVHPTNPILRAKLKARRKIGWARCDYRWAPACFRDPELSLSASFFRCEAYNMLN